MGWDHGLSFLWRFCSYGTLGTGLPPRSHPSRRTSPSRRRSVCFETPTSRATSSAFRPASSCLSAPIICASLCLLFDIVPETNSQCALEIGGRSPAAGATEWTYLTFPNGGAS